jgi:DNA-binding CsgD family transcriptional regulator
MIREELIRHGLSNREIEVVKWISQGLSNFDASQKLFVSEKTVKFHLTNIYKKLKVKSRAELIVWCLPKGDWVENTEQLELETNAVVTGIDSVLPRQNKRQ